VVCKLTTAWRFFGPNAGCGNPPTSHHNSYSLLYGGSQEGGGGGEEWVQRKYMDREGNR
jgi:hypothetical protein